MTTFGRGKKPGNVWNNTNIVANKKTNFNASEDKFREAQQKLQAAVQKYTKDYESSSSEDELEKENVIGALLKNYSQVGGKSEHLGRTQNFLEDSLVSGAATCLICIGTVKRIDKIWSCKACYCFFHLLCIERWSKDNVTQQKEVVLQQQVPSAAEVKWGCPKCRHEYTSDEIPREYKCFCGKTISPSFQPWLVPHSCGDTCGKKLQPLCGHECILLCHPGPCPPCPKTVKSPCYCGKKPPKLQRCSNKEWSCRLPCKKTLSCGKHECYLPCHAGECKPCTKQSIQKCECGGSETRRNCATPVWKCTQVCNRPLSCGNHKCAEVCHRQPCAECPLSKPRSCPCGKSTYQLPCTEEVPTCGDTCGKLLECGAHTCNQRCHKDKCGTCLEFVVKPCRCGLHGKEIQCKKKQYLCDTKCKNIRDCYKHPCNRKCCDGNCPPCEKPCGRTLTCGIHKCSSVCHRGPCYPCTLTETVKCRCGATAITVPCGRKKCTRPPKCPKPCEIPPDCHHEKRDRHRCHFGDCPPCRQTCLKALPGCEHACPNPCHSYVLVKVEAQRASMPWEQTGPTIERRAIPCAECIVPVPVTCLGRHETSDWSCYMAKPFSCQRLCGRLLACGNHRCQIPCHVVDGAGDDTTAGLNCGVCELPCAAPRPEGCPHACPLQCHPGDCPPCKHMLRLKCHCGLNQPYVRCSEWISSLNQEQLQSCGSQCPKNYECGHRCRENCHSGPCPNADLCKKKVKVTCPCRRLKKEFSCESVRNNATLLQCDEICQQKKTEQVKQRQSELEAKKREEELRNAKEVEQFQKKFQGKKKSRDRKRYNEVEEVSFLRRYCYFILAIVAVLISIYFVL